jgi:hypothetical protein
MKQKDDFLKNILAPAMQLPKRQIIDKMVKVNRLID